MMKFLLKLGLILLSSLAAFLIGGMTWMEYALAPVSPEPSPPRLFKVEPGASFRAIAQSLGRKGLIRHPLTLSLYAKTYNLDRSLQAGYYRLDPHMSARAILHKLATGDREHFRLTVPEGRSIREVAALLKPYDETAPGAYQNLAARASAELLRRYPFLPADCSLEGYLFPDTYELIDRFGPALLEAQLQRFARVILPLWQKERPPGWPLNLHQTLTLASIVELEAVRPQERPLIAGVFLQRLRLDMPLAADPTVEYALQRHQGQQGLSFQDVRVDSPYNTYRYKGLPPTPIGNPGLASFRAVLEAQASPFLFFVARGDGTHVFSRTGNEHREAVRDIQRSLLKRSNGKRSEPQRAHP